MSLKIPQFDPVKVADNLNQYLSDSANEQGLQVVIPGADSKVLDHRQVKLSERLSTWLADLRLLRHVPLAYLVPDPALLPTESIRFFHVDPTWADRVVDGVMAAGNLGTLDMTFTVATLKLLRQQLDQVLGLDDSGTMTGMLIRSQLVTRWPDMIVKAFVGASNIVPVLRQDSVSKSIMIVLFAGVPTKVTIREPHVGLRFGVDPPDDEKHITTLNVPARNPETGAFLSATIPISLVASRVIDVQAMLGDSKQPPPPTSVKGARETALLLQRPPYLQQFLDSVDATTGSELPYEGGGSTGPKVGVSPVFKKLKLRRGRTVALESALTGLGRLPGGGK